MGNSSSIRNFAMGFALGLLGGISLALLLAPKSGRESRESVKNKMSEISDTIKVATSNRKRVYSETWKQPKVRPYSGELDHRE
jgi:gas vesicle protein